MVQIQVIMWKRCPGEDGGEPAARNQKEDSGAVNISVWGGDTGEMVGRKGRLGAPSLCAVIMPYRQSDNIPRRFFPFLTRSCRAYYGARFGNRFLLEMA
jgi:hypothetical protein